MPWRWRWGWQRRGRPPNWLFLSFIPQIKSFLPQPMLNSEPISISYAEFEALRLVDLENLKMEEAAKRMNTSRGTIWRLVNNGRKKLMKALVESRPLIIEPKGKIEKLEED